MHAPCVVLLPQLAPETLRLPPLQLRLLCKVRVCCVCVATLWECFVSNLIKFIGVRSGCQS